MSLLAIKIGNTNIALGLFKNGEIERSWRIETRPEMTEDEYGGLVLDLFSLAGIAPERVTAAAIVSVVPSLTGTWADVARSRFGVTPFVVGPGMVTGIKIRYQDPRTLGADRLVAVIAARARHGSPAVVIDFGTATTFNALDAAGDFGGGAIAPGLNIESEALHLFTARLPRVEISPPARAIATNTPDALRSGIFFGYAGLVEGMVARFKAEMAGPVRVVATGGLASRLAPYCPSIEIVDPDLAFHGLAILYDLNHENENLPR
ncbi:MAG: type III pantothenate kinase [Rudaea sp.]